MLYDRSRKLLGTGMVGCIIALFSVNSQVMKGLADSGTTRGKHEDGGDNYTPGQAPTVAHGSHGLSPYLVIWSCHACLALFLPLHAVYLHTPEKSVAAVGARAGSVDEGDCSTGSASTRSRTLLAQRCKDRGRRGKRAPFRRVC